MHTEYAPPSTEQLNVEPASPEMVIEAVVEFVKPVGAPDTAVTTGDQSIRTEPAALEATAAESVERPESASWPELPLMPNTSFVLSTTPPPAPPYS